MDEHKGHAKNAFWRTVHNEPLKKDVGEVSKMLQDDQPTYRLKPPAIAQSIDAQSFNSRCQIDINTHRQTNHNQTSKPKETVTKQFNHASDSLDQITDKKKDRRLGR